MQRIPETRCPNCDYRVDSVTCPHTPEALPSPGDCMLCLACGKWNIYGADMQLRRPTNKEARELNTNTTCRQVRALWMETIMR